MGFPRHSLLFFETIPIHIQLEEFLFPASLFWQRGKLLNPLNSLLLALLKQKHQDLY